MARWLASESVGSGGGPAEADLDPRREDPRLYETPFKSGSHLNVDEVERAAALITTAAS
jgi:hypothetical protein